MGCKASFKFLSICTFLPMYWYSFVDIWSIHLHSSCSQPWTVQHGLTGFLPEPGAVQFLGWIFEDFF